jgi:hypothetical protein
MSKEASLESRKMFHNQYHCHENIEELHLREKTLDFIFSATGNMVNKLRLPWGHKCLQGH